MGPAAATQGLRYESLIFGLLTMPVGVAVGLYLGMDATQAEYRLFWVFAGFAALLTSAFWWWLLMRRRRDKHSSGRAVAVGVLSGVTSHWLCWYLMLLWMNVDYWVLGGGGSSLGEAPMDPLLGSVGVLAFCFFSLLGFGWLTVSAAVVIALLWARAVRTRLMPRP